METIGERIKQLRRMRAMSQEELGEVLGVKKAAIQKYENGSIINLKTETIEKLSKVFNVSPSYIMGWDKDNNYKSIEEISRDLIVTEELEKAFGKQGLRVVSVMYALNDDGMNKLMDYANDLFMIDYYVDVERRETLLKESPPIKSNLKYVSKMEVEQVKINSR